MLSLIRVILVAFVWELVAPAALMAETLGSNEQQPAPSEENTGDAAAINAASDGSSGADDNAVDAASADATSAEAVSAEAAVADEPPADGPIIELAESEGDGLSVEVAESGGAGPSIELPDEVAAVETREQERARILRMTRRVEGENTVLGGYAQLNLTSLRRGADGDFDTTATVRRLVLLVTHQLTKDILTSAELEWENAIACASCRGSVEVEQAYLDWSLVEQYLTLRAGLVLMPIGLINQWHEPPVFHGVERPNLDRNLIPTTWRELGVGFTGHIGDQLEYTAYWVTTVSPQALGPDGFVGGRSMGSFAPANAGALTGRLDYEPTLGVIVGASGYAGDAGGNGDFFTSRGKPVDLFFPIYGASFHARVLRRGWEAKALAVAFWMPEAGALLNARRADGIALFPNVGRTGAVPMRMQGGYLELGYDVLHPLKTQHQLVPFARLERVDNQAAVPRGYRRNLALRVNELTTGLTYRPARQVAFKTDIQLRDRKRGLDELQLNAGFGYMY